MSPQPSPLDNLTAELRREGAQARAAHGRLVATADHRAQAERWLSDDPDPETRAELELVLAAGDDAALASRFGTRRPHRRLT